MIKSLGNSYILLIAWVLLLVLSAALCFIGLAMCVDTELNESGKFSCNFIDMFHFVHRRIRLCLNLMRSLFYKMYAEQVVEFSYNCVSYVCQTLRRVKLL